MSVIAAFKLGVHSANNKHTRERIREGARRLRALDSRTEPTDKSEDRESNRRSSDADRDEHKIRA